MFLILCEDYTRAFDFSGALSVDRGACNSLIIECNVKCLLIVFQADCNDFLAIWWVLSLPSQVLNIKFN